MDVHEENTLDRLSDEGWMDASDRDILIAFPHLADVGDWDA
jgi:hypothetical protein